MKKSLLLAIITLSIYGCSKSGSTTVHPHLPTITSLSGTYVAYKLVDTTYIDGLRSNGIHSYLVETATTDTSYQNLTPGSTSIFPNYIQNYQGFPTDTLKFTSITTGNESQKGAFTYNLSDASYNVNVPIYFQYRLYNIDATTVKLVFWAQGGNSITDVKAYIYSKQ